VLVAESPRRDGLERQLLKRSPYAKFIADALGRRFCFGGLLVRQRCSMKSRITAMARLFFVNTSPCESALDPVDQAA
jgi:hypothetical protein